MTVEPRFMNAKSRVCKAGIVKVTAMFVSTLVVTRGSYMPCCIEKYYNINYKNVTENNQDCEARRRNISAQRASQQRSVCSLPGELIIEGLFGSFLC